MQLRQTLAREIDVKAGKPGFLLFDKAPRSGTKNGTNIEVLLELDSSGSSTIISKSK